MLSSFGFCRSIANVYCAKSFVPTDKKLDGMYDSHHEAILRMLQMVVDNGHKNGCWVGLCGELGSDTNWTERFLRMGFDELSVSPSMILKIRETIRKIDLSK